MMTKKRSSKWLILIGIAFIVIRICFWPTLVDGHSMEPTLEDGGLVILSKIPPLMGRIFPGDLVVIGAELPSGNERIVKRVIGLPGDHIVIQEDTLYVNGLAQQEAYRKGTMSETLDYYVPLGMVFVLGDNRTVSEDSRYLGCLPIDAITETLIIY